MVLSTPGRADEKDVGGVLQKAQGGELADHGLVYLGLGVEVEVGDVPGGGQTGEARGPPRGAPGLGGDHLDLEQAFQESAVTETLLLGLSSSRGGASAAAVRRR
jgi:hypothetical protein